MPAVSPASAAPYLKWAGGKRQLLPHLRRFYPARPARYYEPFLGSGAVFFDLSARGLLHDTPVVLSDENLDLVGTYLRVKTSSCGLQRMLEELAAQHALEGRACYYRAREEFNAKRIAWRAQEELKADTYPLELAALFIYLNRTGYNGLFRLNSKGEFNVPVGRYPRPNIVNAPRLIAAAEALRAESVHIRHAGYEQALESARPGDFVYLDPPYAPLSSTASFRHYTATGFSAADQVRLRDCIVRLARHGVSLLLSNSTAPDVVTLYSDPAVARVGLRTWRVPARRAINSRSTARGQIEELLVSNLAPSAHRGV